MTPSGRDIYKLTRMITKHVNVNTASAISQVQAALARQQDESVKLERQRRRLERKRLWASRWAIAWAIVFVVVVAYVALAVGDTSGAATASLVAGGAGAAVASGALAIRSTRRMVLLKRARDEFDRQHRPPAVAGPRYQMPPKSSAAHEPMVRLGEAEEALGQLVRQLAGVEGAPGSVPLESVEHAERTGAEAAQALRAVAAQLAAVELARDHAPPMERGPLIEGVRRLRDQLDEGLTGYRSLVAAAGRVVAASSSAGPKQELTDATDHLAGLAVALRELSEPA